MKRFLFNGEVDLIYLNRVQSRVFDPYNYVVVPKRDIQSQHCIMVPSGVTVIEPGEETYTMSLDAWQEEHIQFTMISKLPFFRNYLLAKVFHVWRQRSMRGMFNNARASFTEASFWADSAYCKSLLYLRGILLNIGDLDTVSFGPDTLYTLDALRVLKNKRLQHTKVGVVVLFSL